VRVDKTEDYIKQNEAQLQSRERLMPRVEKRNAQHPLASKVLVVEYQEKKHRIQRRWNRIRNGLDQSEKSWNHTQSKAKSRIKKKMNLMQRELISKLKTPQSPRLRKRQSQITRKSNH
jgi:hypothetical protein